MKTSAKLKSLEGDLVRAGVKHAQVVSNPPLSAKQLDALQKKHKQSLPDEVRAFYLATNGQTISWSTPDGGAIGRSSILNVQAFLASSGSGGRAQVPYYSKVVGDAAKRELDRYWVFESMYADSFILLPTSAKSGEVPVFLLQYPDKLTRLDLSFPAYVEGIIENKAILNWQEPHKEKDQDPELIASFRSAVARIGAGEPAGSSRAAAPAGHRRRVDDLVKKIKSTKGLSLVEVVTYPAPPLNALKKIEATFGRKLPASMIDFYSQVNGLKLIWRTKPGVTPAAAGLIDMPPLEQAFGGEHHASMVDWDETVTYGTLWDDELRKEKADDFLALKNKRVLDRHLGRQQVLMEVTGEGVELFYYVDGGVSKLAATFDEFVDLVLRTGGLEYYPELLRPTPPEEGFKRAFEAQARLLDPGFQSPAHRAR